MPNIVVILADDMGIGELGCFNPEGKIKTPALDALAGEGMVFTDAHSGSSVCTPTRYGLLTGRYSWRTHLQKGVMDIGKPLIADETLTIAEMLSAQGYDTAMFGKWHLGFNLSGGFEPGGKYTGGPTGSGGFDFFRGFNSQRQMSSWIEDDMVKKEIELVEMLPALVDSSVEYIASRKGNPAPFFMYIPWNSPHKPIVPSAEWQGKSGLNAHADFVMQTDDAFGQVVEALKQHGFWENTLVICTSDNGTSAKETEIPKLHAAGHFPSGPFRGLKTDIWEGGHRVPFIATWPNRIKRGIRSHDLVCLTDIMATVAEITGHPLGARDAVDSISFASTLTGASAKPRSDVIHHSINGNFSLRDGRWKLVCCRGSGGWSPSPDVKPGNGTAPSYQLYDMEVDPAETKNLVASHPEIVQRLRAKLQAQIDAGATRPGSKSENDARVSVDKARKRAPATPKNPKKKRKKK